MKVKTCSNVSANQVVFKENSLTLSSGIILNDRHIEGDLVVRFEVAENVVLFSTTTTTVDNDVRGEKQR